MTGEWVTTITARQSGRERGWVWVDVNAPPSPRSAVTLDADEPPADAGDARWTAVPRLVQDILSVTDARDGEMILGERPTLVTVNEIDDLISAICDLARRGAAIVAAPIPGVAVPRLIDHVERLTRECVGLAGIYALDTDAAAELEASFGRSHSVPLGAIRTFLPGDELAVAFTRVPGGSAAVPGRASGCLAVHPDGGHRERHPSPVQHRWTRSPGGC